MNKHEVSVSFSAKKDDWQTPQKLFDKLDKEFHFTIDVCASDDNAKCERYFTKEVDGLLQEWSGVCWCNPPYGKQIELFCKKAVDAEKRGVTTVMLVPVRSDTKWFQTYCIGHEIRLIKGRVKYEGGGTQFNAAPFPSMLIIFNGQKTYRYMSYEQDT